MQRPEAITKPSRTLVRTASTIVCTAILVAGLCVDSHAAPLATAHRSSSAGGLEVIAQMDARSKGKISIFDVDGSSDTEAYDINNGGYVVGYYYGSDSQYHGFVRSPNGTVEDQYDPPGSKDTYAYGIDEERNIAGVFSDGKQLHGFFNHIAFDPDGSQETDAYVVSDGVVPGYFLDKNGQYRGFLRSPDGTIATYDIPEAVNTYITDYANGYATGFYFDGTQTQCFLLNTAKGTHTVFGVSGSTYSECYSINPQRDISGDYLDSAGAYHGFIRSKHGDITTFDVPGATDTFPNSNHGKNGTIVGNWIDADNHHHAFIRAPNGKIKTYDVKGATWTNAIDVNRAGEITAFIFDKTGNKHSYVRLP